MKTQKQPAVRDAERYVRQLVEAQNALGYRRPKASVVKAAVGEAAQAVEALSALSAEKR